MSGKHRPGGRREPSGFEDSGPGRKSRGPDRDGAPGKPKSGGRPSRAGGGARRRRGQPVLPPEPSPAQLLRLQTFLSRAGVASRRAAEELISTGRVTVNGRTAELGSKVDPEKDHVRVDGRSVRLQRIRWIALHKPRGYVTTRDDPSGRKTVYDLLPEDAHHLFHVGRLDRDSSGLVLFTNDGETANRLLHPRYGTLKEYRADVEGRPSAATLERLVEGVELEDGTARAVSAELRGEVEPGIYRLIVVLQEGRNREVRRMLDAVGHPVRRLFRRSFGPIEIGRLKPGAWRELSPAEIESLTEIRRSGRRP
jgi:23S rRNA pseudouridine2605 synthase